MKCLFVGLGSISTRHIKNLYFVCKERGINLDVDVLRRKIDDLPDSLKAFDLNQIISIEDDAFYDCAFITNPTNLHYHALLGLRKKAKYYFIEKPIFENCDYSLTAVELDYKNSYIACPMRHTKVYKELSKLIADKKVFSSRIICSSYLPDWRSNQDYRKNYSAIKSLGGGVTIDLIHEIDYMIDLFGFPKKVINMHGKYSNLEIDSDDLSVYIADYNDKLVEVHLDYFGRKSKRSCDVFTEEGTFFADYINSCIYLPNGDFIDCREDINERYINEIRYYLNFIEKKVSNINDPEKALKVLSVALGNYKE